MLQKKKQKKNCFRKHFIEISFKLLKFQVSNSFLLLQTSKKGSEESFTTFVNCFLLSDGKR